MVIYKLLYWSFFLWKGAKIMGRNLKGKELGEGIYKLMEHIVQGLLIDLERENQNALKSCKK